MTEEQDLGAHARSIVDTNRFMALGRADASGTPWVSPIWKGSLLDLFEGRSQLIPYRFFFEEGVAHLKYRVMK